MSKKGDRSVRNVGTRVTATRSKATNWGDCPGQGELWNRPQLSKARPWKKKA